MTRDFHDSSTTEGILQESPTHEKYSRTEDTRLNAPSVSASQGVFESVRMSEVHGGSVHVAWPSLACEGDVPGAELDADTVAESTRVSAASHEHLFSCWGRDSSL